MVGDMKRGFREMVVEGGHIWSEVSERKHAKANQTKTRYRDVKATTNEDDNT